MAKRKPIPLKLYFVICDRCFEADFVIARTVPQARRVFREMYGSYDVCDIELITRITKKPRWVKGPMWVGADPGDALEVFGGKRLDTIGPPRWQFGDRVIGYPGTDIDRYRPLMKR